MNYKKDRNDLKEALNRDHKDFSKYDFSNEDLSRLSFKSCKFIECNMREAKLSHSKLYEVEFSRANLTKSIMKKTYIDVCDFSNAIACGIDFSYCEMYQTRFHNCDLSGAKFENSLLSLHSTFTSCDLRGARLKGVSFANSGITSGSFFRTNLADVDFSECCFDGASCWGASFSKSCFRDASFKKAALVDSDFRNANCQNADFSESDLRQCNFSGADLSGANLENTLLKEVKYDDLTEWPKGFDPKWSITR